MTELGSISSTWTGFHSSLQLVPPGLIGYYRVLLGFFLGGCLRNRLARLSFQVFNPPARLFSLKRRRWRVGLWVLRFFYLVVGSRCEPVCVTGFCGCFVLVVVLSFSFSVRLWKEFVFRFCFLFLFFDRPASFFGGRERTERNARSIEGFVVVVVFCFVLFYFFYIFHRWKSRGRRLPKRTEPSQIDPSRDPRKNGSTWLRNGPSRAEWIRAKWIRAKLTRAENEEGLASERTEPSQIDPSWIDPSRELGRLGFGTNRAEPNWPELNWREPSRAGRKAAAAAEHKKTLP